MMMFPNFTGRLLAARLTAPQSGPKFWFIYLRLLTKKEELLVYGHGPLSGKSEILDARTVRFQAISIPAHQFLEIRLSSHLD